MRQSHEAIDRLLRNRPPFERLGVYDLFWSDTLRKWVDEQRYPGDAEGEPVCQIDHFNLDMAGVGGWFDVMPIRGYSEIVEETEEWKAVRNGAGAVLKWWKNKSGTPEHVDFRMTSRDIWERDYRPPSATRVGPRATRYRENAGGC